MGLVYMYWAWIMVLLPVFFYFIYTTHLRTRKVILRFFTFEELTGFRPRLRYVLNFTAAGCLLIAVTGPYVNTGDEIVSGKRKEVYFLLDVSASMNAQDVSPSRLEKAKDIIRKTAAKLQGERLGLIAFTDYAYVQCPLTDDREMFLLYLDMVSTRQFGNKGTNFRKALTRVLGRFSEETGQTANRFIVFLSDGENYSEGYHSVMQKFKKTGIGLFAVGIGTSGGALIPAGASDVPSKSAFIEDENGVKVITRLNEPSFKELVKDLNAPFVKVTTGTDPTEEILSYFNRASLTAQDEMNVRQNQNLYLWFLGLAVLCLGASMVLMPMKKTGE